MIQEFEIYKKKDWISHEDMKFFTRNTRAIAFLEKKIDELECPSCFSANPEAMPLLEKYPEKIDWVFLASNPNGIFFLEKNWDKIQFENLHKNFVFHCLYHPYPGKKFSKIIYSSKDLTTKKLEFLFWTLLSMNPNAISLLEKFPKKINSHALTLNPNCMGLCEKHHNKFNWSHFSKNPNVKFYFFKYPHLLQSHLRYASLSDMGFSEKDTLYFWNEFPGILDWKHISDLPSALPILEKNLDKINWDGFSKNPNAISILEKFPEKINWTILSQNPNGIRILEKNMEKINWFYLSENPNAIFLLECFPEKIDWVKLSKNPNLHLFSNEFLEMNKNNLNWSEIIHNPHLVPFIKKYIMNIHWGRIHYKKNFFWILDTYREFISFDELLAMRGTIEHILHKYITIEDILTHPEAFTVDRLILTKRMDLIRDELTARAFCPDRISLWKALGYDLDTCI